MKERQNNNNPCNQLEEKLKLLPDQPGIYRFFSNSDKIIYIGKAKNLKHRVRSYFLASNQSDFRLLSLVPNINNVEWIVTHTEAEALILEDHLIKTHRPRYNIQLKDDKSYPYFKISLKELYPRLSLVREIKEDGSAYFGPYVVVNQARATWRVIKKYFPLRQSKIALDGKKTYRPCLNYQLERCLAPCAGLVTSEKYGRIVQHVIQLLKGNLEQLINNLKKEMAEKAQNLEFEEAAKIRNQIDMIRRTLQKQRVVSNQKIDRDVFALIRSGSFAGVQVLFIRHGILLSDDFFWFKQAESYDDLELIRSALSKLYVSGGKMLPSEILLPIPYDDATMLEQYCSVKRAKKLKVISPQRGEKKALLELALKNGQHNLTVKMQAAHADEMIIKEVKQTLKLKNLPVKVECFDISNISGANNVGSMIVWEANQAVKAQYRKYKIRTVQGANDYAALEEMLSRRYKRLRDEQQLLPDLIVIDGGKGQLASAVKILQSLEINLEKVDLIGLAKGKSEKRAGIEKESEDFEYVVKQNRKNIVALKKNSSTLYFLQNIRDEAHRFALKYHRSVRGKTGLQSDLENIPGIGPKKRKVLLKTLGNIQQIRRTDPDNLKSIKGISAKDAQTIHQFFNPKGEVGQ